MNLVFKRVESDQFDQVLNILQLTARNLNHKNIDHWQYWLNPSESRISWLKEGVSQLQYFFAFNDKDQQVGMFRLMDIDELYWGIKDDKARYIHSIVILPEFTGQEWGQKMILQLEKLIKNDDVDYLRLDCNKANPFLCSYYESLGFVKVGEKLMPHSLNNLYEKKLR